MTATRPTLPDHNGETVEASQIKFSGLGTGFDGLDVDPMYLDFKESGYFVVKATAGESPSVKQDRKGKLVWLNRLTVDSMAPIDQETAERVLREYREAAQEKRDAIEGQLRLDQEHEAEEREAAEDEGLTPPSDIAAASANRVKSGD